MNNVNRKESERTFLGKLQHSSDERENTFLIEYLHSDTPHSCHFANNQPFA
jgi:hypothetical protein